MDKLVSSPVKVLIVTLEYGRHIQGGIGRVVNGIFNSNVQGVIMDIFLIKLPVPGRPDLAYLYTKSGQPEAKCVNSGDYISVLHQALHHKKYNIVHFMNCGELVNKGMNEIKTFFPDVKIVYSCHSIAKHELDIRNNRPSDLVYEECLMNSIDHVHVLNNTSLRYLTNCYASISTNQISIIPNGIEEEEYKFIDDQYRNDLFKRVNGDKNIVISCICRWSFGKGLEHFIDAIPMVIEKNKNVRFIIAGRKLQSWENKVDEYVTMIDRKIESVSEYVIPLGWVDNKARNTIFSMTDICVMPSLLEYFPYGILEPMICKVPIISSKIDSVSEMIEENKECLFYCPEDSKDLANKIISLADDKNKMQNLAEKAFHKVKNRYNWDAISRGYASMYQSLLTTNLSAN
jgi:glycosyltransferase involved in cell wall biosynthesis